MLAAVVERTPGAVLVAHSLGCPLVAHLAHRRPHLPIAAALLVAPADVDSARHTPEHIRGFAPIPLERLPFRSIVVGSRNDPYMSFARAREVAFAWGAGFVDAGAVGHINVASGFGPWPDGKRLLAQLIGAVVPNRRCVHAIWRSKRSERALFPCVSTFEAVYCLTAKYGKSVHSRCRLLRT